MAVQDQSYKDKIAVEKEAVSEATDQYDALITALLLIATSNRSRADKMALIAKEEARLKKFNSSFSQSKVEKIYKKFSNEALSEMGIVKKKISPSQKQELVNLSSQLENSLNQRLSGYISNAKKLVIKEELKKLRESKLNFKDAQETKFSGNKKEVKDIIFTDSKGRKITNELVMKVTAGDAIWDVIFSSKRSTYLLYGFRYAKHVSILDEKTTEICLFLDGKIRDLMKDKIPPMHPNCRSKIELILEKNTKTP